MTCRIHFVGDAAFGGLANEDGDRLTFGGPTRFEVTDPETPGANPPNTPSAIRRAVKKACGTP